jgi:hypothetical protein
MRLLPPAWFVGSWKEGDPSAVYVEYGIQCPERSLYDDRLIVQIGSAY